MLDLDNYKEVIKTQGGDKVIKSVDNFQNQLFQSFTESLTIQFPEDYKNVSNIIVCGMGGSRFPALIIQSLYKDKIKIPYSIVDDYVIPKYINEKTLVILSSYSGTTEEVIECAKQAIDKRAKITAITKGGEISNMLKSNNVPIYIFDAKYNPSGQPRIGLGYPIGAHLGFLVNLDLIEEDKKNILDAINNLNNLSMNFLISNNISNNPAKDIALNIYEKYPYFIVSEFLTGVGNAIANQTNETAKSISSFRIIPELNHHLMEGLKHPEKIKENTIFLFLFSQLYSKQIQKRFYITKDVVEKNKIQTIWLELKGKSKLEQVFELLSFGSYFSTYLAALYSENPTVIPYVDYFKKKLKE